MLSIWSGPNFCHVGMGKEYLDSASYRDIFENASTYFYDLFSMAFSVFNSTKRQNFRLVQIESIFRQQNICD